MFSDHLAFFITRFSLILSLLTLELWVQQQQKRQRFFSLFFISKNFVFLINRAMLAENHQDARRRRIIAHSTGLLVVCMLFDIQVVKEFIPKKSVVDAMLTRAHTTLTTKCLEILPNLLMKISHKRTFLFYDWLKKWRSWWQKIICEESTWFHSTRTHENRCRKTFMIVSHMWLRHDCSLGWGVLAHKSFSVDISQKREEERSLLRYQYLNWSN